MGACARSPALLKSPYTVFQMLNFLLFSSVKYSFVMCLLMMSTVLRNDINGSICRVFWNNITRSDASNILTSSLIHILENASYDSFRYLDGGVYPFSILEVGWLLVFEHSLPSLWKICCRNYIHWSSLHNDNLRRYSFYLKADFFVYKCSQQVIEAVSYV